MSPFFLKSHKFIIFPRSQSPFRFKGPRAGTAFLWFWLYLVDARSLCHLPWCPSAPSGRDNPGFHLPYQALRIHPGSSSLPFETHLTMVEPDIMCSLSVIQLASEMVLASCLKCSFESFRWALYHGPSCKAMPLCVNTGTCVYAYEHVYVPGPDLPGSQEKSHSCQS